MFTGSYECLKSLKVLKLNVGKTAPLGVLYFELQPLKVLETGLGQK